MSTACTAAGIADRTPRPSTIAARPFRLSAMKLDVGTGAVGLMLFAVALAVLLSVGLPIVMSSDAPKASDFLSFGGNVIGAVVMRPEGHVMKRLRWMSAVVQPGFFLM
jgi:hypothetical protein